MCFYLVTSLNKYYDWRKIVLLPKIFKFLRLVQTLIRFLAFGLALPESCQDIEMKQHFSAADKQISRLNELIKISVKA